MKKIYKLLSVITLAVLTTILIVGCGKKTTKATTKDTTTGKITTNKPTTKDNSTTKETKKSYSISLTGEISDVTCSITTLSENDGTATYVPVDLTKKYEEGKAIFVTVNNLSSKNVKLTATIGTTVKEVTINAGESGGFKTPTDCLKLTGDLSLKLEELEEVITENKKVRLGNDSEVKFSFYYYVGSMKFTCNDTTTVKKGTTIYPSVTSTLDFEIMAAYSINGNIIQKLKLNAGSEQAQSATFQSFEVTDDVMFDYTIYKSCKLEFNSKVEGANFIVTNKTTDEVVTESGLYFDSLTEFEFALENNTGNKVIVNIYQFDEDIAGLALLGSLTIEGESFTYPNIVPIYDDLKLEIVDYVEYNISIEGTPDGVEFTLYRMDPFTYHGDAIEGGNYPLGTILYAGAYNTTDKKALVRIVDANDTTKVITSFEVEENDSNYPEDMFFLSCDIKVNIIFDEPALPSYTLTIYNSYSDVTVDAYYFLDDTTPIKITSTTEIPFGASVLIEGNNSSMSLMVKMYLRVEGAVANNVILGVGDDSYGQITLDSAEFDIELYIEQYELVETYSVVVNDTYSDIDIKLFFKDDDEYVEIQKPNCILKGREIFVRVNNTSDSPFIILAYYSGGETMLSGVASANEETLIGSFILTKNATVTFADYSEITIAYTTIEGVTINCYNQDNNTVLSGSTVFKNAILNFEVVNGTDSKIIASFTIFDYTFGFTVDANSSYTYGPQAVPADFSLTVEEYVEYNISIKNDFSSKVVVNLGAFTDEGMTLLYDGDTVPKNTPVLLSIANSEETAILLLTIKNGSETVYNGILGSTYGEDSDIISIKGDFSITITYAMIPSDDYTIEDQTNVDIDVLITIGENDDDFDPNEAYEEGTIINLYIDNDSDDEYIIYVVSDGEQNIVDPIHIAGDGYQEVTFELTCDVYITCEIVISGPFAVYYDSDIEYFTVKLFPDDGDEEVGFGDDIEKGTEVYVYITNELDYDYTLTVLNLDNDEVIESLDGYANSGDWLSFTIDCDCYITVEIDYENDETYGISVSNEVNVPVSVYYVDEEDEEYEIDFNEKYEEYTTIVAYIQNSTENPIIVEILDEYSVVIEDLIIYEGDNDSIDFALESDVTISIKEYIEEFEDGMYLSIFNDADEDVNYVVKDANDNDVTEKNIANISTLYLTVANNSTCNVVVLVKDAYHGVVVENIVMANDVETMGFEHESDVDIYIYKHMNARITIQGEIEGFTWEINDDFEDYFEDGDVFHYYGDDLYFDGISSSKDKTIKVTIYDTDNEVIGYQNYYIAPEGETYRDGVWFNVYTDILIVIEEIEVEEYTLTIDTDLNVVVSRGSITLNDGDTLYGGERLCIDFDNDTDQTFNIIGFNDENDMLFVLTCEAGEYAYYIYEGVSSNITIIAATGSVFPTDD